MVRKLVSPASTSVRTVVPFSLRRKNLSSMPVAPPLLLADPARLSGFFNRLPSAHIRSHNASEETAMSIEETYQPSLVEGAADRLVIISGCSGGGKSTLLADLARRGHAVREEAGRQVVKEQLYI